MYVEPTSKRITLTREEELILREILNDYIDLKTSSSNPTQLAVKHVSFAETLLSELKD